MNILTLSLTLLGLSLFEIISSIDNAIINAEVLSTMQKKYQKFFLLWGILFAVFVVRGLLPLLLVWFTVPNIGILEVLSATFSNDPIVTNAIEQSAPILLIGGGTFLIFLFFNWLFLEDKNFGLYAEKFFQSQGAWFYAVVSVLLCVIVWFALKRGTAIGFGAVVGSTAFFITHGFKQFAANQEVKLKNTSSGLSGISKILYLEVIDTTFSIDGVVGAFAFTLSIPIIFLGNGLGAIILRNITVSNIERIKKYKYLKNGAMYSILVLGIIMVLDAFGFRIPEWLSPASTFTIIGYFFYKSNLDLKNTLLTFSKSSE